MNLVNRHDCDILRKKVVLEDENLSAVRGLLGVVNDRQECVQCVRRRQMLVMTESVYWF